MEVIRPDDRVAYTPMLRGRPSKAIYRLIVAPPNEITIADVANLSERELLDVPNCGVDSVAKIKLALKKAGLSLSNSDREVADAKLLLEDFKRLLAQAASLFGLHGAHGPRNVYKQIVEGFVEDINATGGVAAIGTDYAPVADPEWTDLGDSYMEACRVLNIPPTIYKESDFECDDEQAG